MNRREFFRQAAGSALMTATATVSATALQAREQGATLARDGGKAIGRRLDAIEERFDRMERRQKHLVRAGAIALTISTGIDLFTIL